MLETGEACIPSLPVLASQQEHCCPLLLLLSPTQFYDFLKKKVPILKNKIARI